MIKIFDNCFSEDFLMQCYLDSLNLHWRYNNTANRYQFPKNSPLSEGTHKFFGATCYERISKFNIKNSAPDSLMAVLEYSLEHLLKDTSFYLQRIDGNLQLIHQDGTFHKDFSSGSENERTLLFFPMYKWNQDWGGEFEYVNSENEIEKIPISPGKLIFIDSLIDHRGTAPLVPNIARISIAFRLFF